MRLDHNRSLSQIAEKTGSHSTKVEKMVVWGNHSATQYPDISHATVDGKPVIGQVDNQWYVDTFIPTVQQRGAAIIKARGGSPVRPRRLPPPLTICVTGSPAAVASGQAWGSIRRATPTELMKICCSLSHRL